jgi:hypothetical protein
MQAVQQEIGDKCKDRGEHQDPCSWGVYILPTSKLGSTSAYAYMADKIHPVLVIHALNV